MLAPVVVKPDMVSNTASRYDGIAPEAVNGTAPALRTDVLELKDLKPGMVLTGTVRNVIDFGVFVDIGVHQDGLVHISQVCNKFIKHPSEAVSVGDVVRVAVLEVDEKRKRISLTMRGVPKDGETGQDRQKSAK